MEDKYQITLTRNQLSLISQCVEDCCRFASGQTELSNLTSRLDNFATLRDELKKIMPLVTPELSRYTYYGWNGGTCPNESQRKFIAQTYPIYREILHFFAVESGTDNVYAFPTLTCEEGGKPIEIKKI